jgi:hypothetical protein
MREKQVKTEGAENIFNKVIAENPQVLEKRWPSTCGRYLRPQTDKTREQGML